jgi:hypothetical protein
MSLFAGNMISHWEKHKDFTHTHTERELKDKVSKVTGYNLNIQKSMPFLYTNNEHTEKEIWKAVTFMIITRNKILGISLYFGVLL